jgi:hypothetical protein
VISLAITVGFLASLAVGDFLLVRSRGAGFLPTISPLAQD